MIKRPWTVTLISILIIVVMGLQAILNVRFLMNDMPIQETIFSRGIFLINVLCLGIGIIVFIAGSILALEGVNIGRWLIIIWCIVSIVLYSDSVVYALPKFIHTAIITLMLFNKPANRFFRAKKAKLSYLEEPH